MRVRVKLWAASDVGLESRIGRIHLGLLICPWSKGHLERVHGASWRWTAIQEEDLETRRGAGAGDHLSWRRWDAVWPA